MSLNFKHLLSLAMAISLLSCTKVVDIPLPNEAPKIVISSYITAGDSITVLAGMSTPFSLEGNPVLDSFSTVELFEDGRFIDTLTPGRIELSSENQTVNFLYTSPYRAKANSSYKIKVGRTDGLMAFGFDVMPGTPQISAPAIDTLAKTVSFSVRNTDEINYYVFECFAKLEDDQIPVALVNHDPRMQVYSFGIIYSGSAISSGTRFYLKNENNNKGLLTFTYNPSLSVLSDSLHFKVSQISRNYYLHELSKGRQQSTIPIFSEPAKLYSNIEYGYGIVACSQQTQFSFLL